MPKSYLPFLGLLLVVVVTALVLQRAPRAPGWVNLLSESELKSASGGQGFQRWVERPGDSPLLLTLKKHHGGNRNRGWTLEVSRPHSGTGPAADRRWSWRWADYPKLDPHALATFQALECIEDFQFGQTVPQFWYRVREGKLEVLARQRANPWNRDFNYEEGYYWWTPGEPWRKSNSWGTPGEPATCRHAKVALSGAPSPTDGTKKTPRG